MSNTNRTYFMPDFFQWLEQGFEANTGAFTTMARALTGTARDLGQQWVAQRQANKDYEARKASNFGGSEYQQQGQQQGQNEYQWLTDVIRRQGKYTLQGLIGPSATQTMMKLRQAGFNAVDDGKGNVTVTGGWGI